jgi:class 3 adenylate cyclase
VRYHPKIGCIAVALDERLDYFGQTVKIGARVQDLAMRQDLTMRFASL